MTSLFAGIDVGSSAVKAVVVNRNGEVLGSAVIPSGIRFAASAGEAHRAAAAAAGVRIEDVAAVAACGYGRRNVEFANATRTEIACLAKGIHRFFEESLTVLDIGGRDIKVVRVDEAGWATDFKMNAQCAASTGAFLEDIAARMQVPLEQFNALAAAAQSPVHISAHCTVFAAGEVLAAARDDAPVENIILGIYLSMVRRIVEMTSDPEKIVISGGVAAYHPVLVRLAGEALGLSIATPPHPQLIGALGAALFAIESARAEQE